MALNATQRPACRDAAQPHSPKASYSSTEAGWTIGMPQPISDSSLAFGIEDETAAWSSPTTTSTPPLRVVPAALPWRSASPARSSPGPLPYHMPKTPSKLRLASTPTCWVPISAVAARSSLMAGRNRMSLASRSALARQSSTSTPASGEPR